MLNTKTIKWLAVGIVLTGAVVAQTVTVQKTLQCGSTPALIQGLQGSAFEEKPIWWGIQADSPASRYSLFVNDETKTWTLIQFNETIACVIGTGEASTQIFTGPKI